MVGGNVTAGSNFEIDTGLAASSFGALSVYGNVTDAGARLIVDNGAIAIAGSNNANFNLNGGGSALCRRVPTAAPWPSTVVQPA